MLPLLLLSFYFWVCGYNMHQLKLTNDLQAYKDMKEFRKHDEMIALAVERSLLRHSWYLSEKLAVCSIADEDLPDDIRKKIATKLLKSAAPAAARRRIRCRTSPGMAADTAGRQPSTSSSTSARPSTTAT